MKKASILIAVSILILGCSNNKESSITENEEMVSENDGMTELDKCLSRVGMSRETTTSDMSLIDVASNEIMAMDRDTQMGTNYEGYDHECLELYLDYVKTNDMGGGQDSEFEEIYEDANYDTLAPLDFNVSVAPTLYRTYDVERFQTQITIISKNDNPVVLTDIVINRGNTKNCAPYGPTSNLNKTMGFGDKVSIMLWHTCKVGDIIEVGVNTTSGNMVYTF